MKTITILLCSLLFVNAFSQSISEKEIKTEVNEVTVFIDGAQITRKKTVELESGTYILKFVNLSPFIDAKSVQVKAKGEITVLSVNHQQNFINKSLKPKELIDLEWKVKELDAKIQLENTYLSILKEELSFLQANRDIGGKDQAISVTNLKESSEFYGTKLTLLKLKEIERNKTLDELTGQKNNIEKQINTLTSKKEFPTGEVLIKIEARKATRATFEISYMTSNAGWFPTYDIRAKNINEPVELVYKANVRQDTKEDWKDIKLRFSSSDPNVNGVAPELKTYFLNYNILPPVYNKDINTVKGKVLSNNGEPLAGAIIIVEGTTIGAVADIDGNYSIVVPDKANNLKFSFIGFKNQILPITNPQMNVILEEDTHNLEEIVVTESSDSWSGALQGKAAGVSINKKDELKTKVTSSLAIPLTLLEKQTSVDFEIKTPYTITSDNKSYSIDMETYDLPATYKYFSVPKIDKDAFLIAYIIDWEKYNLLEGEANIFFEDTYVGKTLLDVRYASDTLNISLGRDKNVSVNRQKVKDFTSKQFIGAKKEETRAWTTTVKNNKKQKINMIVLDQVPVSTSEEIEVVIQTLSGAQHKTETGEVKWEFSLEPNDKKEFELKYVVKYPKYRNLALE